MLNKYADCQIYNYDMGKWWEHCKMYFENINDIIKAYKTHAPAIRYIKGKQILFTAKDKQNREYKYQFKGFIKNDSRGNIELYNLDLKESTIIEFEWFNQRHIKPIN